MFLFWQLKIIHKISDKHFYCNIADRTECSRRYYARLVEDSDWNSLSTSSLYHIHLDIKMDCRTNGVALYVWCTSLFRRRWGLIIASFLFSGDIFYFSLRSLNAFWLFSGIYFTAIKYKEYEDQYPEVYEEYQRSIKTKRDLWLTGLIILSVFTAIVLLILIFLRKRIVLAIALIREGSK